MVLNSHTPMERSEQGRYAPGYKPGKTLVALVIRKGWGDRALLYQPATKITQNVKKHARFHSFLSYYSLLVITDIFDYKYCIPC